MSSPYFTKTQRGSNKLVHEGYSYNVIRYGNNGRTYWRCDETRLQCKGSVATDKDNKVDIGKMHNHAPSSTRVQVKMAKTCIREAALQTNVPTREVINSVVESMSEPVKQSLPMFRVLQRTVTRKRKLMDEREVAPKSASATKTYSARYTASCAVNGCKNGASQENKSTGNQPSLFPVPKNPDMREKWCESLGQELGLYDKICELHFEKSAIESYHMHVASDDTIHLRLKRQPTLAEGAIPVQNQVAQQVTHQDALSSNDQEELKEDWTNLEIEGDWNETLLNSSPSSSSLVEVQNYSQVQTEATDNSSNTDGDMQYLVVIEEDSSSNEFLPEQNYSINQTTFSDFEPTLSPELKYTRKKEPETTNPKPETVKLTPETVKLTPETVNLKPETVKPKRGVTNLKSETESQEIEITNDELESMNQEPETVDLKPKTAVKRKCKGRRLQSETESVEPESTNLKVEAVDYDYCDIDTIKNYLRNNPLPKTWAWTDCSSSIGVVLSQISNKTKKIRCYLECNKDLRVQAFTFDNLQINDIDTTITSIEELLQLLELATTLYLCEGVQGGKKRAEKCTKVIPVREQFKKKKLFNRCTPCRDLLKELKKRQQAKQKNKSSVSIKNGDEKGILIL